MWAGDSAVEKAAQLDASLVVLLAASKAGMMAVK